MPAALLIIDMQVGLFHGPEKPYQGERILANIRRLVVQARTNQVPIFAVRHTGPQGSPIAAGSPFWQLLPALELDADIDTLFDKFRPNAFHGTDLARQLQSARVEELYVVGMKSQFCIDSTCRSAADLGFTPCWSPMPTLAWTLPSYRPKQSSNITTLRSVLPLHD